MMHIGEADLQPVREALAAATGIPHDKMSGFVAVACGFDPDGSPVVRIATSDPSPRTVINLLETITRELRAKIAEQQ